MLPAEKDTLFSVKLYTLLKTQDPKKAALIPLGWIKENPWDIYTSSFFCLIQNRQKSEELFYPLCFCSIHILFSTRVVLSNFLTVLVSLCDEKSASFPGQFAQFEWAKDAGNRGQILLTSLSGEDDWERGAEKSLDHEWPKNSPANFLNQSE